MVKTKKMILELKIEIDIPVDILQDSHRVKAVEDGLSRSISKGLYDQGVSFEIKNCNSKITET
ncbi:MAG: hypothetical protein M3270_04555 [Thermoproteota archaeon]|nr:hypothetical protein [Thermoproteota archaeon]